MLLRLLIHLLLPLLKSLHKGTHEGLPNRNANPLPGQRIGRGRREATGGTAGRASFSAMFAGNAVADFTTIRTCTVTLEGPIRQNQRPCRQEQERQEKEEFPFHKIHHYGLGLER